MLTCDKMTRTLGLNYPKSRHVRGSFQRLEFTSVGLQRAPSASLNVILLLPSFATHPILPLLAGSVILPDPVDRNSLGKCPQSTSESGRPAQRYLPHCLVSFGFTLSEIAAHVASAFINSVANGIDAPAM